MKKRNTLLVSTLMLSLFMLNAQNTEVGDKIINLGLGIGNNYYSGSEFSTIIPPITTSFEMIIKDKLFENGKGEFGIGGQLGLVSYKYSYDGLGGSYDIDLGLGKDIGKFVDMSGIGSTVTTSAGSEWKYSSFIVGPRGYLHYGFLDNLDTYTGIMLGLQFVSSKGGWDNVPKTSDFSTGFVWAWFAGGRYYFNDKFAAMLELGYGVTYANIGIAYKLAK